MSTTEEDKTRFLDKTKNVISNTTHMVADKTKEIAVGTKDLAVGAYEGTTMGTPLPYYQQEDPEKNNNGIFSPLVDDHGKKSN
eukprot:CAMPEP_0194231560 /NCGR_PEP_ID=MMETSP0158-20130606/259_1 /TAXON_ID=33649 /ORGANISM="Thalassionema nitzschioides, Strain L26-B" /LENGTH=82 /DNA_ID=CAMNT_0038964203 /DNA_START=92 /DNA_END=340 /DNA_ORIENTATION=-